MKKEKEKMKWIIGFYNESYLHSSITESCSVLIELEDEPSNEWVRKELAEIRQYYKFWGIREYEEDDHFDVHFTELNQNLYDLPPNDLTE